MKSVVKNQRILFFFVHPSKVHIFRYLINKLKATGYKVDILIITKDVLEDLVKAEGWEYTNLIPEGRRNKNLPIILNTIWSIFKTTFLLLKYTKGKKYDLFITDDMLLILGRIKGIRTLLLQDDDFDAVKASGLMSLFATNIISPEVCDLGKRWNKKKIAYKGNHELAYLHPNYFKPDIKKTLKFNPDGDRYFIVRLVSLTAWHDVNNKGINYEQVTKLIKLLERYGKVFITAEKELESQLEKYRIKINPEDIHHALYFADIFIGDSQTMTSESAILGTPTLQISGYAGKLSYIKEEERYGLLHSFQSNEFDKLYAKLEELLKQKDLKKQWAKKREKFLKEHIDVSKWFYELITNY